MDTDSIRPLKLDEVPGGCVVVACERAPADPDDPKGARSGSCLVKRLANPEARHCSLAGTLMMLARRVGVHCLA